MQVAIERGVPFEETKIGRYPWENMQVGDSFLANPSNVHSLAGRASKTYHPKVFKATTKGGQFRIWRVK